jgi:hypothetical protein
MALVTLADLQAYLGLTAGTDDSILTDCIDRAGALIERALDRKIESAEYWEWISCGGTKTIAVKNVPITRLEFVGWGSQIGITVTADPASTAIGLLIHVQPSRVYLRRVDSDGTIHQTALTFASHKTLALMATAISAVTGFNATASVDLQSQTLRPTGPIDLRQATAYLSVPSEYSTDTRVDYERGHISMSFGDFDSFAWRTRFPEGAVNVLVHYIGGFETVPADIEQAALEVASALYRDRRRDRGIASESLGDYSYSIAGSEAIAALIKTRTAGRARIR